MTDETLHIMSDDEKVMVEQMRNALTPAESQQSNDTTLLRFLRGRKHHVERAIKALERTSKWREENNVKGILLETIQNEMKANKLLVTGPDRNGRPLITILVRNHRSDSRDIEELTRFVIYSFEHAVSLTNPLEEKMNILFDMTGFGLSCMDYEALKMVIKILETHYPETLHHAYIYSAPMIFSGCWMIIKPWLDPVTASKVIFIERSNIKDYIHIEDIPPIVLQSISTR